MKLYERYPGWFMSWLAILIFISASRVGLSEPVESGPAISVDSTGKAEAAPDLAVVTLLVKEQQDTVKEARAKSGEKLKKVKGALAQAGVKEGEMNVLPPSVYVFSAGPMGFSLPNMGSAKTQQVVSTTLLIQIPKPEAPDLQNVWKIIEAALEAGAEIWSSDSTSFMNQFRQNSAINLTVKNKEALTLAATRDATAKAREQAEAAASGLGMKLGEIVNAKVSCGGTPDEDPSKMIEYLSSPQSSGASMSKITVTSKVTVTYKLVK